MLLTLEDVFPFGRHKDQQVEDVIDDEPSYFEWAVENRVFEFNIDVIKVLEDKKII